MTTIAEIRDKYPQYSDLSDEQLARALHGKHYSDIPYDDFASRIGLTVQARRENARNVVSGLINRTGTPLPPTQVPQPGPSDAQQVLESGGIVRGAQNIGQLSFGQKVLNDARIMKDSAIGFARGVPQGLASPAELFANPLAQIGNWILPGDPFHTNASQAIDQTMTDIGVPEVQTSTGRSMQNWSRTGASMYSGNAATNRMFPQAAQAQPVRTPRQQVLAEGQREGLVAPPASTGTSRTGSFLEGMAGTLKTRQLASARNQEVVNRLAARAIGLSDDTVTPQALQAVRQEAGNAYRAIRGAGTIDVGDDFVNAVSNAVKPLRAAASQSAALARANKDILSTADDLVERASYEADSLPDLIKFLRDQASVAYRAGQNTQGKAYRSMAGALEDAIETGLTNQGASGREMLSAFRNARALIAKTHTIEDALNGSNVAAQRLANMVRRGKPLTDELALIGRFANEFPKGMQLQQVAGSTPAYSPLDWITGLSSLSAAGITGNPTLAMPAAYAMSRPAIRNFLLSPTGQKMLMPGGGVMQPGMMGLIGGGLAVVDEANGN